ncbi:hypothetical protein Pcinc_007554 [Petrolisthes cinctipes]|uniref:Uncharacterized protein n=1 Tax=Petrolisthes cinctipes TaxID=88211 RepID=A0AAE1KWT9_PETCI|nr:hypothetical protein Pcinc_007554 [Petrolisthes cinctipes]
MSMALRLDRYTVARMRESRSHSPVTDFTTPRGGSRGSTDPLSQLTSSSQDESSLQPHYIEQQSSLAALPSTSFQEPSNGSSPRKRPRSHTTDEEDSATLVPAKKQHQDATLNDISSLLLQFAQRFDKLESDMAIVKGSNSQLLQDREKGKSILPFSSSSPSKYEEDDLPPVAQSASSLPSAQTSPSPPPYLPATYSAARSLSPSPIYLPTPILNPS